MNDTQASSSQPIRFFHRGQVVEVQGVHPTRSVLDWLREDARCTGTKEGCNEGDCGACTVVIGELAEPGAAEAVGGLKLQTVNACIQFLPTLHGKALFTVEDLKGRCGGPAPGRHAAQPLHPVQQAMVDCHGSQCGFCTPGFVMSLWSAYEHHSEQGTRPSRQQLADELSGNLCRCTGYRPILDAGQKMFDLPAVRLDTAPVVAALQTLRREGTFDYAAPLGQRTDRFHAPVTLDELAALREAKPQARILAGSTDVGLWVNKMFRDLGDIIYVGDVAEMKRIEEGADALYIGAGASLEDAWRAIVQRAPTLEDVWLRFASLPIRNAGTLGGNVANGSPIGDTAPLLIALGGSVVLHRQGAERVLPVTDFYLGYQKNDLQPGEFVRAVRVPLPEPDVAVHAWKVSKRPEQDISAVALATALRVEGGRIVAAGIGVGGMAAVSSRAPRTEQALLGLAVDQPGLRDSPAMRAAWQAMHDEFDPLDDHRASAAYRRRAAANLVLRSCLSVAGAGQAPRLGELAPMEVQP